MATITASITNPFLNPLLSLPRPSPMSFKARKIPYSSYHSYVLNTRTNSTTRFLVTGLTANATRKTTSNSGRIWRSDVVENRPKNVLIRSKWNWLDIRSLFVISTTHGLAMFAPFCFSWGALRVALVLWFITGILGICLSYHRNLTHKSFKLPKWLEYLFAYFGNLALQMASSFDENDNNERFINLDDNSEEDEVQTSHRQASKAPQNVKPPRPPKHPSTQNVDYLRRKFNNSECDVLGGKYLHMRCAAHILNLVVKDGLHDIEDAIKKVRTLCKYVKASPARKEKFQACILEEKITCKSLVCLDVETRWNSTYLMLDIAIKFKKAFGCLYLKDSNLEKEMNKVGGDLTTEEWKQISSFLPFLKIFYDATLKLSGSLYVTSNDYVEVIFGVGELISKHLSHKDDGVRKMAAQMKLKYDKYWGKIENLNLLLFVSLILDPRYKFTYVEWMVKRRYGEEKGRLLAMNIRYFFQVFFDFYADSIPRTSNSASSCSSATTNISPETNKQDDIFNFGALMGNEFEMEMGDGESEKKSEWEKYLSDERESRQTNLRILQWWKDNQKRYPILAKMARDVLAIPVSTVASESAFSTGGRVLDSFRTCLNPRMVEALICAQDWLRTSHTPMIIEEILFKMENIEEGEGMKDLVLQQPLMVIDEADG